MQNEEKNPKPECRKLSVVRSPVSSFGFRHSSFGFGNGGSWKAPTTLMPCIRTMNRSGGTQLVWSPAFRRSGPAKAGTPNGRFMERGGAASPRAVLEVHKGKPSPPPGAVAPVHPAVVRCSVTSAAWGHAAYQRKN